MGLSYGSDLDNQPIAVDDGETVRLIRPGEPGNMPAPAAIAAATPASNITLGEMADEDIQKQQRINAEKHDRFRNVAERRTTNALHSILLLKYLKDARYEYTPLEAEAIVSVLTAALEEVEVALSRQRQQPRDVRFQLPTAVGF